MKVVTTVHIKTRMFLLGILITIFGILSVGSVYTFSQKAIDASSDTVRYKTVIIDAGHGGVDGGTSADDGTLEKDLNLQIALKLNEMLKSFGVKTVLIRDSDISIHDDAAKTIRQKKISDLKNRLNIINNTEESVFVSIHQNHFGESKYYGTQIFYSKNNPDSRKLADCIRMPVISYLQPDNTREIKQSGTEIYLLNNAESPSVMVECGFLSNANETSKLKDENYQRKLAFIISLGIIDYFSKTEDF